MKKYYTIYASVNGWTRPTGILEGSKAAAMKAAKNCSMCQAPCDGYWLVEIKEIREDGSFGISDPIY